jgi:hypothetical protein
MYHLDSALGFGLGFRYMYHFYSLLGFALVAHHHLLVLNYLGFGRRYFPLPLPEQLTAGGTLLA